ncbi:MAG TPA: gas vesicle protein GvpD P-loop domain-containing protein [Candidatus Sulfotelmatobacter sp.]|jgi:KaiC/GvpD/RAD55 family RecA-like ATPase|nr:gas vesicle protein GvpD P-loop domain-containing protein [Candidatus Sulfotelmatobacter sp.]
MTAKKRKVTKPPIRVDAPGELRGTGPSDLAETRIATVLGLKQFISAPIGTLLIKGLAGTGKTTVALEILKAAGEGKGAYLSSRVPKELLETHIPAMKKTIEQQDFLDIRLEDMTSVLDLVMQLTKDKKVKTIVFDSWDGLAKELDPKERLRAEKTLMAVANNSGAQFIFVSEEPGATTIDYLVDGIVEVVRAEEHDRALREFIIHKLRGTKIPQHKYIFTLLEGKFTFFGPYAIPDYSKLNRFVQRPDIGESYSFGSGALDRLFGGIIPGSTMAIEYDEHVPYPALRAIELPPIINFLSMGRSAILLPLPGANDERTRSILAKSSGETAVNKRLRILNVLRTSDIKTADLPKNATPKEIHEIVTNETARLREESANKSVLLVKSISALENLFASDLDSLLEVTSQEIITLQQSHDADILFLPKDSPIRSRILSMSSSYATLFVKDGTVLIYGVKPHTGIYALQHLEDPTSPSLTQLV